MSNEYNPQFGLGLNYYRENSYDASQRLGRDAEESEYGSNGVFALYGSSEHNPLEGGSAVLRDLHRRGQRPGTSRPRSPTTLPLDTETWFSAEGHRRAGAVVRPHRHNLVAGGLLPARRLRTPALETRRTGPGGGVPAQRYPALEFLPVRFRKMITSRSTIILCFRPRKP